ncbi:hypothetical protein [Frankia sp. AiPs1]
MIPSHDVLTHVENRIGQITAGYERAPIGATAVYLRRHLPAIRTALVEGGHPSAVDERLQWAAGRLTALWATARHDLGDTHYAGIAFTEAFEHAELARDRSLQAWVRLWQSSLARKAGRLDEALQLARDASAHVGRQSAVAGRAAAIEARVLGARGDRAGVHLAINRAWRIEGALSDEQKGEPGFSIDTLNPLTLAELSAAAYVELGQPDAARIYTDAALARLDRAGATGLRSMARIAAATAELHQGDADRAEALVIEALDISAHRPNAVMTRRARRFLADARRRVGHHRGLADIATRLDTWDLPAVTA